MRSLSFVAVFALVLAPVMAAAEIEIFTLSEATPFSAGGLIGTINPISDTDADAFDFSGMGTVAEGTDGDHICEFFNFPQEICNFINIANETTDEFVSYTVTLDPLSAPLPSVGTLIVIPNGSGFSGSSWAGYIFDSEPAPVVPTSSFIFSLSIFVIPLPHAGRGHSFKDIFDGNNQALWLQPGESTTPLLLAYPEGLAADIDAGAEFDVVVGDPFTPILIPVSLVSAPEPAALMQIMSGVLFLVVAARFRLM